MGRLVGLMALLLIASALIVLVAPLYLPPPPLSAARESAVPLSQMQGLLLQVRTIAEQVNAPLSVVVGLLSLYYTRKTYLDHKR